MIVTGFLMKSYRKLREKTETEGEVYEDHLKIERRQADARDTFNRMSITDNRLDTSDPYGIKMTWSRWRRGGSCD